MRDGYTIGNQLYRHLLVFILLEEPKTVKQLLDELTQHGFPSGIKAVQRTVRQLENAGFPVECKEVRGDGHRKNVWQWRETTNVVDNLIKAKAGLGLRRNLPTILTHLN